LEGLAFALERRNGRADKKKAKMARKLGGGKVR
jgi:hypothetical protein